MSKKRRNRKGKSSKWKTQYPIEILIFCCFVFKSIRDFPSFYCIAILFHGTWKGKIWNFLAKRMEKSLWEITFSWKTYEILNWIFNFPHRKIIRAKLIWFFSSLNIRICGSLWFRFILVVLSLSLTYKKWKFRKKAEDYEMKKVRECNDGKELSEDDYTCVSVICMNQWVCGFLHITSYSTSYHFHL